MLRRTTLKNDRWNMSCRTFLSLLMAAGFAPGLEITSAIAGPQPEQGQRSRDAISSKGSLTSKPALENVIDLTDSIAGYFYAIDTDPSGNVLAFGYYDSIRLYGLNKGKRLDRLKQDNDHDLKYLTYSADGKAIGTRRYEDTRAVIFNLSNGSIHTLMRPGYGRIDDNSAAGLAFSNKGDKAAVAICYFTNPEHPSSSGTSGWVDIYSTQTGRWLKRIGAGGSGCGARVICFAQNDRVIVTACNSEPKPPAPQSSYLSIWDIATGKIIRKVMLEQPLKSLVPSPDGKLVAACSGASDKVTLMQLETSKQLAALKGRCVAFSSDSKLLTTGSADGMIRIWALKDDHEFNKPTIIKAPSPVDFVKMSGDGTRLIAEAMATSGKSKSGLKILVWRLGPAGK